MKKTPLSIRIIKNLLQILPANNFSDRLYIINRHYRTFGVLPNLSSPETFNEKIHWTKLHVKNPIYSKYVDKFAVREIVANIIGEEYLVNLLGVYNDVDEIDFAHLPNKFILKATHGSGWNIICTNKSDLIIGDVKKILNLWLSSNYYLVGREWPYDNIPPRIICEELIESEDGEELKDYKVFCFNGKPTFIQVDVDRFSKHKKCFYDLDWKKIEFTMEVPSYEGEIQRPNNLELMLSLAEKLSSEIIIGRIDFYHECGKIFFGEITLYHGNGFHRFAPLVFDKIFGKGISING